MYQFTQDQLGQPVKEAGSHLLANTAGLGRRWCLSDLPCIVSNRLCSSVRIAQGSVDGVPIVPFSKDVGFQYGAFFHS